MQAQLLWCVGGLLSFCGALCYAELATSIPRNGGDYEFLNRAYGRGWGFVFGWAQLTIVLTGSIGSMGYAFADYAKSAFGVVDSAQPWIAAIAVVILSIVNAIGAVTGVVVQNILSAAKIIGLALVAIAAFFFTGAATDVATSVTPSATNIGLATVFVLYAYGGWNDAAYVSAEIRDPNRNIPRALLGGIVLITAIYLIINFAYLKVLGFERARETFTPAADVLNLTIGANGGKLVSILVMISALGAINGMILTGARIYSTMGQDYQSFSWMRYGQSSNASPLVAILVQCVASIILIFGVGTEFGRNSIDGALALFRINGLPWDAYFGGFETLVAASAPIFWLFFLMTGLAVFVLRYRFPEIARPFKVPGFPIPVIVFCCSCGFMLYSSLSYAGWLTALAMVPLGLSVVGFVVIKNLEKK